MLKIWAKNSDIAGHTWTKPDKPLNLRELDCFLI